MKQKKNKIIMNKWTPAFAGGLLIISLMSSLVYSFTSLNKQAIEMSVTFIGGLDIGDEGFTIDFSPILGISPADNVVLFQGGAGDNPRGVKPNFQSTLSTLVRKKDVDVGPAFIAGPDNSPIHVTLYYRFVGIGESPDAIVWTPVGGAASPVVSTSSAVNASFAFLLDPNEVKNNQGKNLQYYFLAQKFQNGAVVKSTTSPSAVGSYWTLNVTPNRVPEIIEPFEARRISIPQGNPNVANTTMEIPQGTIRSRTTISITDMALNLVPQNILNAITSAVSIYRVEATPAAKGPYKFTLSYPDFVFPVGQLGKLGTTDIPEQNAIVYGWDGVTWRKLGGKVNPTGNTISVNTNYYSYLGIAPGEITPLDRRAHRKIITPNGDGNNELTDFTLSADTNIQIFDSSMHKVRSLSNEQWDGRDEDGKIVESGAYIYQYKVDGELVSGVIGVAK